MTDDVAPLSPIDLAAQFRMRRDLSRIQRADHYYFIDIVGTCNLTCPSCPVGNWATHPPKGHMSIAVLQRILEKIQQDQGTDKRIFIDLYNWGEPTLHPDLAGCIKLIHSFGFSCGISSNMNVFPNMRDVLKAAPDYIRISVSGFYQDSYGRTHRGGDINAVKGNMYLMRHWLDRYEVPTVVEVGFHLYRANFPEDFLKMRELCDDLEFIFAPVIATMMPAEKAVDLVEDRGSAEDQEMNEQFVISMSQWRDLYRSDSKSLGDCQFRQHRTTINFDGSVSLCCAVYDDDKKVADSFLDSRPGEITRRQYAHEFCGSCMKNEMFKLYTGVSSSGQDDLAIEVLGPVYEAYLNEARILMAEDTIEWEGRLYGSQAFYEMALAHASMGSNDDATIAERMFERLAEDNPRHGAAYFQLSRLDRERGDVESAFRRIQKAVELAPEDEKYLQALEDAERLFAAIAIEWEGTFYTSQEFHDKALAVSAKGADGSEKAERMFEFLVRERPRHGAAFYQLSRLARDKGDLALACQRIKAAVELAPDVTAYREALKDLERAVDQ